MKNTIFMAIFFLATSIAYAGDKVGDRSGDKSGATVGDTVTQQQPTPADVVPSTQINDDSSSTMLMKIQSDDKDDDVRRKAFIEELRRLYKTNFL
jgi:hypothetical protein